LGVDPYSEIILKNAYIDKILMIYKKTPS